MPPTIDTAETVNKIIATYPETVSVFNALAIDACCGADATVEDAARRDGVNLHELVLTLRTLITRAESPR